MSISRRAALKLIGGAGLFAAMATTVGCGGGYTAEEERAALDQIAEAMIYDRDVLQANKNANGNIVPIAFPDIPTNLSGTLANFSQSGISQQDIVDLLNNSPYKREGEQYTLAAPDDPNAVKIVLGNLGSRDAQGNGGPIANGINSLNFDTEADRLVGFTPPFDRNLLIINVHALQEIQQGMSNNKVGIAYALQHEIDHTYHGLVHPDIAAQSLSGLAKQIASSCNISTQTIMADGSCPPHLSGNKVLDSIIAEKIEQIGRGQTIGPSPAP